MLERLRLPEWSSHQTVRALSVPSLLLNLPGSFQAAHQYSSKTRRGDPSAFRRREETPPSFLLTRPKPFGPIVTVCNWHSHAPSSLQADVDQSSLNFSDQTQSTSAPGNARNRRAESRRRTSERYCVVV